ncbi:hypothetical protein RBSWK_06487 [Rhodopirellula baltica SWK14]|uniref:Uncharacterized protein n=1 Tax=Rhodopirellula baltica SWK14 TaxID=993516 RepID=L7C951_RHOBT|nr:hypothetical protein RBSWK_06487 [Rhodopirellula baltica SWK14]
MQNDRDRSKTIDSPINCVAAKTIHVETLCLLMTMLGMRGYLDATFCPDLKANPSASERTRQMYRQIKPATANFLAKVLANNKR